MEDALMLAQQPGTFWMPEQAATVAPSVDFVFYFIFYISAFFFLLIVALMLAFTIRYRRRTPGEAAPGRVEHHTGLELLWSVIPTILVCIMFWVGFKTFMEMRTMPAGAYEINVTAIKWNWTFRYPGGIESDELHVPLNKPVRLIMRSEDVIHSLYIPAFREKRDVVPGRYSDLWFKATKAGRYPLLCAEYCGTSHSDMTSVCVVQEQADFDSWLESADPIKSLTPEQYQEYVAGPAAFIAAHSDDPKLAKLQTPAMLGETLFTKKGCAQCHNVDGTANTGPPLNGVWGHKVQFTDGSSLDAIDENYVRESILDPGKRVVAGFENVMSKISVNDREIDMLMAYIKSLRDK